MEEQVRRGPPGNEPEWNAVGALIGGGGAGLVGAGIWYAIAAFTGYEVGYIAWGIGFIVGFGAAMGGKVGTPANGLLAAVLSAASILLGKFLATRAAIADYLVEEGIDAAPTTSMVMEILPETLGIIDIVFFGLALYTAWQVASGGGRGGE